MHFFFFYCCHFKYLVDLNGEIYICRLVYIYIVICFTLLKVSKVNKQVLLVAFTCRCSI